MKKKSMNVGKIGVLTFILLVGIIPTAIVSAEEYIVEVSPEYIVVGSANAVDILVMNGSSEPLNNTYVSIYGCGVDTNGTTNESGVVEFIIMPSITGVINIDVEYDGNTMAEVITVTDWVLNLSVSDSSVYEGDQFNVTVLKENDGAPVEGALVEIGGGLDVKMTNETGIAVFTAPEVTSDVTYDITAEKEGFAPDVDSILVLNKPQLYLEETPGLVFENEIISLKSVIEGAMQPIEGVLVAVEGIGSVVTDVNGYANFTAPEVEVDTVYNVTAEKDLYKPYESVVAVLNSMLEIISPMIVDEEERFTVMVINKADGLMIQGATVKFGELDVNITNETGIATFMAPMVECNTTFNLTASKDTYTNATEEEILVNNSKNPKLVIYIEGGIKQQIDVKIYNQGNQYAKDVKYNVTVKGGILGLINKCKKETLPEFKVGLEYNISLEVFGLGFVSIDVTVNDVTREHAALVIGKTVLLLDYDETE